MVHSKFQSHFRIRLTGLFACCSILGIVASGLAAEETATPRSPNVVIIFFDDMGYADIEPFGSKVNRTPHLNRMAEEAMRFTDFYVGVKGEGVRPTLVVGIPSLSVYQILRFYHFLRSHRQGLRESGLYSLVRTGEFREGELT